MENQIDFFRGLHTRDISEIKKELLIRSQSIIKDYNEIVKDYRHFIYRVIGIDQYISCEETKEKFADLTAKELKPFSSKKISRYKFDFEPPYRLVFDFITIGSNNFVKVSHLKVAVKWDKVTLGRDYWEKERERISVFVFGAFKFREACKLILSELLEPKTIELEKGKDYKTTNLFKVGLLFARGEMNKYFKVTDNKKTLISVGYSAPRIARELNNNSYNKWILATINNYTTENANSNKNIFNNYNDMMGKIIEHCKDDKIDVDPYFLERYKEIEPE